MQLSENDFLYKVFYLLHLMLIYLCLVEGVWLKMILLVEDVPCTKQDERGNVVCYCKKI